MLKLRKFLRNDFLYKFVLYAGFTCFLIILNWIVIFKIGKNETLNTTFNGRLGNMTLKNRFLNGLNSMFIQGIRPSNKALKDFFLNVLAFTPFGIYLPLLFKKPKFFKFLLIAFSTTVFFEFFQLFTIWGCFNVDDLIANTLGFIVGFIVYLIFINGLRDYHVATTNLMVVLIATPICLFAIWGVYNDFNFYRDLILLLPLKY